MVKRSEQMSKRWVAVPQSDGSADVRLKIEHGTADGELVAHYPVRAVAEVVVEAHNEGLGDEQGAAFPTFVRVVYPSREAAELVKAKLSTALRGDVLLQAARQVAGRG